MDWIKIKTKHVLYNEFTNAQIGILHRVQALTAHLERIPTNKEIYNICSQKQLENIEKILEYSEINIEFILKKVLEDVSGVEVKRQQGKDRQRKYRDKDITNNKCNASHNEADKIRLDKIRLDKNNTGNKLPAPVKKNNSQHVLFLENWSKLYKDISNEDYKIDWGKDSKLVTGLIKQFGYEKVIEKSEILFNACQSKNLWFTKGGISDFTIGKLHHKWNELLKNNGKNAADVWLEKELKKDGK